jgi:uncharacterized protein DUF2630
LLPHHQQSSATLLQLFGNEREYAESLVGHDLERARASVSHHPIRAADQELVDREHELRSKTTSGDVDPESERRQLAELEVMLDQCWDLLRQRRARIDQRHNPDEAEVNPAHQVEGYLQ